MPEVVNVKDLPDDILLQAYNSKLAPWTSREPLPSWPSREVAIDRCLRCIDELHSYHFKDVGITSEGRVIGTAISEEARDAVRQTAQYKERGPHSFIARKEEAKACPVLVTPMARPALTRMKESTEDLSVRIAETHLRHADMNLPEQTKTDPDGDKRDIHEKRAEAEGLTYQAAKVRNFMDMYGPGNGLDIAIRDGTVNETTGKLISDTYKASKLGGGFAHMSAFVSEIKKGAKSKKGEGGPLAPERQTADRKTELAMYAGTTPEDDVVSETLDGEQATLGSQIQRERALADMTPGQRRMALAAGPGGTEAMRVAVAAEQRAHTDKAPERTAGTPLEKSARSQDALLAVIGLGKDRQGRVYGPDNNPRKGDAAKNFALYFEGMTLQQLKDKGGDISEARRDARHNRITLTVPRKD